MSKKNSEKKISRLEHKFDHVLVCKKENIRPYLEIFSENPDNASEKNLGTISGILEIEDYSEESSYIVNYLISIIKKEYFSRPKRGAIESFESTLHKANLALSKLAEHGNVSWVGKINALIFSVEKNNLHVAKVGRAYAFLVRGKSMTDITESEISPETSNPMKTFTDVLSGQLEKGDKFIAATDGIFDIFSFEEIKKSALKFSFEDFVRFLKTALGNELEKAQALIMEAYEKEILEEKIPRRKGALNAFSQSSFSKSEKKPKENEEITQEIQDALLNESEEFVDKNGHIYIKEDPLKQDNSINFNYKEYLILIKEKIYPAFSSLFAFIKNSSQKIYEAISRENFRRIANLFYPLKKYSLQFLKILWSSLATLTLSGINKTKNQKLGEILPKASKIKSLYSSFNSKQKISAIIVLFMLFVAPYFFVKWQNSKVKEEKIVETPVIPEPLPLEKDKNVTRLESFNELAVAGEIKFLVNLNDKIFAVGEKEIFDPSLSTGYPFPGDFQKVKLATPMDDLKFIFIMDENNKIYAWSPITKKYQPQSISLPENSEVRASGTFLTYLYLLDAKNNQIYRYPRGGEGFALKTDWLRGGTEISGTREMAVAEAIYLTDGQGIMKFFKNKKENFNLESSATLFEIDKIYARPEGIGIYFLDRKNSRLVKVDLAGNIVSQFYHPEIASATSLAVDEKNNSVYLGAGNRMISFGLGQ